MHWEGISTDTIIIRTKDFKVYECMNRDVCVSRDVVCFKGVVVMCVSLK